jgi:hypothetical protein
MLCTHVRGRTIPIRAFRPRGVTQCSFIGVNVLRKIRTIISFGADAGWLTLVSAVLAVAISVGFHVVGVARTQRYVRAWASGRKIRPWTAGPRDLIGSARRAQRAVGRNIGIQGTCLARSMTLWAMLLRFGLATDLRLGMRKRSGSMEGHAWLEYEGVPINESRDVIRTYDVYPNPVSFDAWTAKGR